MKNILLVEDDPLLMELYSELIATDRPRKIHVAGNGVEALVKINTYKFDLVITDLAMPNMDGIDLAKELRRTHPNIKIILLSGNVHEEHTGLFDRVLGKPIRIEEFTIVVDDILSGQPVSLEVPPVNLQQIFRQSISPETSWKSG